MRKSWKERKRKCERKIENELLHFIFDNSPLNVF